MHRIDFRIDWGYAFVYSRRQYHPEYCWDGTITCDGGAIESVYKLHYPFTWWGPVHSAQETKLHGNEWGSTTRRGIAGIRVVADCTDDAQFTLCTAQGDFHFSAKQILEQGRIVFPVGWKYS